MRTPIASESEGGPIHEADAKTNGNSLKEFLPTPLTTDYKQTDCAGNWNRHSPPLGTIVHSTDWGKYAPAIELWEKVLGIQAPDPTKPDGREGNHRLNAEFAEWLMGIPGRLNGVDLTRKERLKMAGNGVCPQQAYAAFSELLERIK